MGRLLDAHQQMIRALSREYGWGGRRAIGAETFYYLSWVPPMAPFWKYKEPDFSDGLDRSSTDAARIFVMTNTGYADKQTQLFNWTENPNSNFSLTMTASAVNLTECTLYNASYNVDYNFQYPLQTAQVSILDWLNPLTGSPDWTDPMHPDKGVNPSEALSYRGIMQTFGKILLGYSYYNQYSDYTKWTSSKLIDVDWDSAPAVQTGLERLFQNMTLSMLSNDTFV